MKTRGGVKALALILGLYLVVGCSHVMSSGIRQAAKKEISLPMVLQNPDSYLGQTVIWGGVIIETVNVKQGTEIKVLETPLYSDGFPQDREQSHGRFIGETSEYLDPEIYRKGTKVTIGGELKGTKVQPLGETSYPYPVISVKEMHLWKDEALLYGAPYPGYFWYPWYYDPWYYPYWGPGYYPYSWYPLHPHRHHH
jgi:outer membrane lipoprotein